MWCCMFHTECTHILIAAHSPPPPPRPTNNFVLKKYGPNRSVRWKRRLVRTTILQNAGNTSLGTRHPAHSKHKLMEASN